MMNPYYVHDCDECVFVKNGVRDNEPVDWYVCGYETVVCRYGDDGPDYGSATFNTKGVYNQEYRDAYIDYYSILEEARDHGMI